MAFQSLMINQSQILFIHIHLYIGFAIKPYVHISISYDSVRTKSMVLDDGQFLIHPINYIYIYIKNKIFLINNDEGLDLYSG